LNVIFCCHDVRGTVFRVQGPYLKIENSLKMVTIDYKSQKNKQKIRIISAVAMMMMGLCSGSISNYRTNLENDEK